MMEYYYHYIIIIINYTIALYVIVTLNIQLLIIVNKEFGSHENQICNMSIML